MLWGSSVKHDSQAQLLVWITKSFYRSSQLQHYFYAPAYMGCGQEQQHKPHPVTLDKQHTKGYVLTL
jgi:hypothetical protein